MSRFTFGVAVLVAYILASTLRALGVWLIAKVLFAEGVFAAPLSFMGSVWIALLLGFVIPVIRSGEDAANG